MVECILDVVGMGHHIASNLNVLVPEYHILNFSAS